MQQWLFENAMM